MSLLDCYRTCLAPHLDQVGQTGTRIAPAIYIACGVSGAIQHMIGCKEVSYSLAIIILLASKTSAESSFSL
ncbi:MAG: hypothetical protein DYG89_28955 [Caldilinea sp. CFX5]|nr:hypothetical protein [Caldilinea sp. CFX5]